MNKIRILSALMAFLLCLSMLLTACGSKNENNNKDNDESNEDAVSGATDTLDEDENSEENADGGADEDEYQAIYPTIKLDDVVNTSWKMQNKTLASIIDTVYAGSYSTDSNGFLVTKEAPKTDELPLGDESKMITRVYNLYDERFILDKHDSKTVEVKKDPENADVALGNVVTQTTNYVDIISKQYFSVLSMTFVDADYDGDDANLRRSSNYFGTYLYDFDNDHENDTTYVSYTLVIYDFEGKAVKSFNNDDVKKICSNSISRFEDAYGLVRAQYEIDQDDSEDLDLIVIGSKFYRYEESSMPAQLIKDFGTAKIPSIDGKVGDVYIEVENNDTYTVYDESLNLLYSYELPSYYDKWLGINVLQNGSIVVQYSVLLEDSADKYDFKEGSLKYDLVTVVVNKDGITECNDVNYIIDDLYASVADENGQLPYAEGIENVAVIYPITLDKLYDESDNNVRIVTISNDLKTIQEIVADERLTGIPYQINNGNIAARVISGDIVIYNENGEREGVIGSDFAYKSLGGKYVVALGDAIYEITGNKVFDLTKSSSETYDTSVSTIGSSAIIGKYDKAGVAEYSLFANGLFTDIDSSSVSCGESYYVVKDKNDSKYSYYNEKGEIIESYAEKIDLSRVIFSWDGFDLCWSEVDNNFYKLNYTK